MTVDLAHPALSLHLDVAAHLPFDPAMLWEGWPPGMGADPCHLTIRSGAGHPAAPLQAAPIAYGSLNGWATGDTLVLKGPRGGLRVDYATASAVLTLPEAEPDPAFARDTLWRLITLELARIRDRYYLHGAAWQGPGGADVACADGGVGKSTLAAAVFATGRPVITDDAALLVPGEPPQVTALPTAWRLSLPASDWCGLPPVSDKQRFWPPADRMSLPLPIGRLLFVERGESLALLPLSAAEALPRLIRQNPLLMTSQRLAGRHLEALRQLVESVPTYRLLAGPELLSDPQAVKKLLAV